MRQVLLYSNKFTRKTIAYGLSVYSMKVVPLPNVYTCSRQNKGQSSLHVVIMNYMQGVHFCMKSLFPHHSNEISRAGSHGDLCTVYMTSECCGESAPAANNHGTHDLCNHQCVASFSQCVVKILNKTSLASLPRKIERGNHILDVMITAALRNADFYETRLSH